MYYKEITFIFHFSSYPASLFSYPILFLCLLLVILLSSYFLSLLFIFYFFPFSTSYAFPCIILLYFHPILLRRLSFFSPHILIFLLLFSFPLLYHCVLLLLSPLLLPLLSLFLMSVGTRSEEFISLSDVSTNTDPATVQPSPQFA